LPEPEGPTIKIPTPSTDTQVECLISRSFILTTVNLLQNWRQAAQMSRPSVLDGYFQPNHPIMRFDNLFGNCQPQSRIVAKIIGGTFRIKPVKHFP
jgi:hypothetical protein